MGYDSKKHVAPTSVNLAHDLRPMKFFRRLLAPMLVTVAVLIAFGRAGSFPLLNHWDDESNLSENAAVTNPSWDKLEHFWLHPHLGLYVPLTYTAWIATGALSRSLALEPATAPLNPRLFHWLNILLHLGNCLLLWIGLRLLCKNDIAAALGAVFFAVHPLQVESVVWASSTKDVLSAFFYLASVVLFLRWQLAGDRSQKIWLYSLSMLSALLALCAKPNAVTLPLLLTLLYATVGQSIDLRRSWQEACRTLGPFFAAALAVVVYTKVLQPDAIAVDVPLWGRLPIAGESIWFYLCKIVAPSDLVIDYSKEPMRLLSEPTTYVHGVAVVVLIGAFWFKRESRAWRLGAATSLAFIILLSPNLGFIPFTFQRISTVADRYTYLALAAPAFWIAHYTGPRIQNRSVLAAAVVLLCLFAARTWQQVAYWRDDQSLIEHSLAREPRSAMGHYLMGSVALDGDKPELAIAEFTQALKLSPQLDRAQNGLGMAWIQAGDLAKAAAVLSSVPAGSPYYFLAKSNLCVIHQRQGDAAAGLSLCQEATVGDASCATCLLNLGAAYGNLGRFSEAEASFRQTIALQPALRMARVNLTMTLAAQRRAEEALEAFQGVIALSPPPAAVPLAAVDTAVSLGMDDLAERMLTSALTSHAQQGDLHRRLGVLLGKLGRRGDAKAHLQMALHIAPLDQEAARALGDLERP